MAGAVFSSKAVQSCRRSLLRKSVPLSKVTCNRLPQMAIRRTMHCKSWSSDSMQHHSISRNVFAKHERYFSMSYVNNGWFPWSSSKEPPAIPKDTSPLTGVTPPQDSVTTSSPMSEGLTNSVDVTSNPGLMSDIVNGVIVDPPFTELGLATKWFPNHFVHQLLEFVHLNTGLEWWSTIIIGTVVIRLLTIPLFVASRKLTINSVLHAEEIKKGHEKLAKHRYSNDSMRLYIARHEMKEIYKKTGTGPFKMLSTAPSMSIIFITCVMAVRQMAAVPVPSLLEGGALWFTNLAVPDPYYALPIINGVVMSLYIHTLIKGGTLPANYVGIIRKAKYLPIVLMPLVLGKTSSAVFLYWLTTSVFSLTFVRLLAIPRFREMIKFPETKSVTNINQRAKSKGLWDTVQDWKNDSYDKTTSKMQHNEIRRERKRVAKEQKKILKGKPPITYEIGVDALPSTAEVPDFEREWRPNRPKEYGRF